MKTTGSARIRAGAGMGERNVRGAWLLAAWVAALLSAVASLMALTWIDSGLFEVIAVFSWIFLAAVAVVMTTALLAWYGDRRS